MNQKLITKKEIIPILIILLTLVVILALYSKLPSRVPSHWNFQGKVDGYSSKNFTAFFFPGLIIFIYLLMTFLPFIDPLRKNVEASAEAYFWLRAMFVGFFSLLYFNILYAGIAGGEKFSINLTFLPVLGLLFIGIGFLLPKFKRNYFIGIRTPWTLNSDVVWEKTHQRAKNLFIAAGVVLILGSLIKNLGIWLLIIMLIFLLWPIIDSYFIYRKEKKDDANKS